MKYPFLDSFQHSLAGKPRRLVLLPLLPIYNVAYTAIIWQNNTLQSLLALNHLMEMCQTCIFTVWTLFVTLKILFILWHFVNLMCFNYRDDTGCLQVSQSLRACCVSVHTCAYISPWAVVLLRLATGVSCEETASPPSCSLGLEEERASKERWYILTGRQERAALGHFVFRNTALVGDHRVTERWGQRPRNLC